MRAYRLTLLVILYDTPSVITFITYSNMNSMKLVLYPVQEPYTTFRYVQSVTAAHQLDGQHQVLR